MSDDDMLGRGDPTIRFSGVALRNPVDFSGGGFGRIGGNGEAPSGRSPAPNIPAVFGPSMREPQKTLEINRVPDAAVATVSIVPLHILNTKPAYIPEPVSAVTPPAKRYYIEWGTINEVVATNWDDYFDLSVTTYFFAEITFAPSDQLKVDSWEILTGAAYDTHVTPDWDVGDPRPATMVILLGWVFVADGVHTIAQSGGGSISVGEQITSITEGGAGETVIGKQLVYQRQNHA